MTSNNSTSTGLIQPKNFTKCKNLFSYNIHAVSAKSMSPVDIELVFLSFHTALPLCVTTTWELYIKQVTIQF